MPNLNQHPTDIAHIEAALPSEWPRLVRLCAHFTGDRDAAEDLAQETLIEAWRHHDRVYDWQGYSSWLSAIARNLSLRWVRRRGREQAHLAAPAESQPDPSARAEDLPDAQGDFTVDLERAELAELLDRALALLPADARRVLVEKYIEDLPLGEIADRLGLSAGAVAVRLHRGRLALHRVLTTDLRQQAADYGLAEQANDGWQETRIWCPICGQRRLSGRLVPATGEFALRCPNCTPASDMYIGYAQLSTLQGIKSYRPALTRLLSWSDEYYRRRRTGRAVHCLFCGQPAQLHEGSPICAPEVLPQINPLYVKCDHCGEITSTAHAAVALCLPEGRQFWKEHPRIHLQSAAQIEASGSNAIVSSFASLTDSARFEVVTTRDTIEVIGIHVFP